jgi:hypothetical protein
MRPALYTPFNPLGASPATKHTQIDLYPWI